jgi:photosystem II stability/assembly factor-like uncharacterized protein
MLLGTRFIKPGLLAMLFAVLTTPFAQWEQPSREITKGIYSLFAKGGDLYAGTDGNGAYRSSDRGATWTMIGSGLQESQGVYTFAEFGGRLFAGTYNGVYYSGDNGVNWIRSSHEGWRYLHVVALAGNGKFLFATSNREYLYPYNGGMFRSADSGLTWTPVNKGFTATIWINTLVQHNNALYVATSGEGIFRSTDNGETWTPFNQGISPLVEFDPRSFLSKDDRLYVGTNKGVYVLKAGSSAWTRTSKGLEDDNLITSITSYENHLFAGSSPAYGGGVFHSSDKGNSWHRVGMADSGPLQVASLAVQGDQLFASTGENVCGELGCGGSEGGVWRASIPELLGTTANRPRETNAWGAGDAGKNTWQKIAVPGKSIGFEIGSRSFVTLKVHDAAGKTVSSLVERQFDPGKYSVPFEAVGQARGPFFIRFRARDLSGNPVH